MPSFKLIISAILTTLQIILFSQTENSCIEQWYYGEGTFYGGVAGGMGNCGLEVADNDTMHAAINHTEYGNSITCGSCIRIIGPKGIVKLKIVDRCPECASGDIDMTPAAFEELAQVKDGRINIKWQFVPCEDEEIKIKFKIGSSAYWSAIQIVDSKYPIASLEYRKLNGEFENIEREYINYFIKQDGIDEIKTDSPGPYYFRITNIHGQTIHFPNVIFDVDNLTYTGQQFETYDCYDCNNELGGNAQIDNCGVCTGGNTGITPNSTCEKDCNDYWEGTAYLDDCDRCVSGTTGSTPCGADCEGTLGGMAYIDNCGKCVGGNTQQIACIKDCNNEWGGSAYINTMGNCITDEQIYTQEINLRAGWNLISFWVNPSYNSIQTILQDTSLLEIKTMDAYWKKDYPEFLNTIKILHPNKGYLIKMNQEKIFEIFGSINNNITIDIQENGWHIIPYINSTSIQEYYNSNNFEILKNFEGFWQANNEYNSIEKFEQGKAYFLKK